MSSRKMKVKVKKKKINIKRIVITLLIFLCIFGVSNYLINLPITNIYVLGNDLISDKEIIELAELDNYPSFIKTYFKDYNKLLTKNEYIKEVEVTRKIFGKIYLNIEEKKPLFFYNEKIILSTSEQVINKYNLNNLPYIKNDITSVYHKFIEKYLLVEPKVSYKISEIEYVPNGIDKERFLLTMTDANYVYITLAKIEKLNKYNTIVSELNNKKGIVYLDSGDYIEIKD